MRAKEFINEAARGLLYRSEGDIFKNAQGQEIKFIQAIYAPRKPGAYNTKEELDAAVEQIHQTYPSIEFVNQPDSATRAFVILEFQDIADSTQKLYFGRYFKQINADMTGLWKNSGLPGGWQLQKAASLKSSYKLKPGDIFPPNSEYGTVEELVAAMAASPSGAEFAPGVSAMLDGRLPVFNNAADKETAIRDDLGEILAPVALIQGLINTPGSEDAKATLNQNEPWAGAIRFFGSKTNDLVDSEILLPSGVTLGISSKGNKGATSSVKNIYKGLEIARKDPDNANMLQKYADQVEALTTLATASALMGPLTIGIKLGVIDEQIASSVKTLIQNNAKDLSMIEDPALEKQLRSYLIRLNSRTDNPRYNVGYHILAVIAYDVADKLNKDPSFSQLCLNLLNTSPILQIYTKTSKRGNDVEVTGFDAIYPPKFKGKVSLDASKVYYATGINGRYTFNFKGS